jgi:bla regulator protein blaR1
MTSAIFNHLWQSTVFAAVAALLALALRENHARARYWLWLAASCKFLVPFSLLVSLGVSVGTSIEGVVESFWRSAPAIAAQPEMTVMFDEISQPFTQVSIPAAAPEHHSMVPELLFGLWACGCAIVLVSWFRRWLRVRAAVRAAKPMSLELPVRVNMASEVFPHPLPNDRGSVTVRGVSALFPHPDGWGWIRIMSSPALIEPGIFGIFRPVLLLPEGIADRLTPQQLQSILAHELCHVKRRDNLAAAMHMIVEAAFWFHPLVWWIGARLVEERERACDEEVLRSGSEPGVYAESILQVCKFYLESPLKCVAGVTGSDLKKRIESIMSGLPGRKLTPARKLMLIAASIGAIAGPVIFGVLAAPHIRAQVSQQSAAGPTPKWDVASVKPCDPSTPQGRSGGGGGGGFSPGTLTANCAFPMRLIEEAYGFYANGRTPTWKSVPIEGAPSWLNSERYTIAAKAESPQGRAMMFGPMMQKLLEDRFKLKIRREIREVPVYNLTIAKGGPRNLKESKPGSCVALDMDNPPPPSGDLCKMFGRRRIAEGEREFGELGVTMAEFSDALAAMTGRNVIDKTGLSGTFDIEAQVSLPDDPPRDPSQPRTGPDDESDLVFAVVQKLGMKLESAKGPGVVYVIEHVERPSDNFEPPVAKQEGALHTVAPQVTVTAKPQGTPTQVAGPPLRFGAAAIKPSSSGGGRADIGGGSLRYTQGMVTGRSVTARRIILDAYQTTAFQLSGGPDWLDSQRFALEGKAESAANEGELKRMLQTLLSERFSLVMHHEKKEMQVYIMTAAKGGVKAPEVKPEVGDTPTTGPPDGHAKHMITTSDLDQFAAVISMFPTTGMPVVNQTGLKGRYRFFVGWDEDDDFQPALQREFGLKLEKQRALMDTLVIDRVEKPSDNFEPPAAAKAQASERPAAPQAPLPPQGYTPVRTFLDFPVDPVDPKSYVIVPGDILRIGVWREPDLTKVVTVRADGRITLVLIGDVQAAGLTPARLVSTLKEAYRERVRDPYVSIDVGQVSGKNRSAASAAKQGDALHVAPLAANQGSTRALTGAPQKEKLLAFEVATIKLCGNGDNGGGARGGRGSGDGNGPSPDRLNLACQPVMNLIRMAYFNFAGGRVNPRNTTPVDGGPAWINSDRYQITAKAEGTPGMEMMRGPMLQALLEDRFKLKVRRESREVPAYAMTVARGGPKLKAFQEDSCVPFEPGRLPPPGPDGKLAVLCAMRSFKRPLNGSPSAWELPGDSLDGFARALGDDMDRIVINKTGLAGKFDFHLEFMPDESTPSILNALKQRAEQNGDPAAAASDPSGGLSIFTAIQQQLGLKLDGSKGAREFLVIDRIERPTEN